MSAKKVKIGSFLTERTNRYKPNEANELGLRRVNKIDFSGTIHLVEHKPTRTNMILVKKGDLLISGINAEKGGVAVYEYEEDAIATIHYSSYLYDAEKIEVEYLKWFLKSNTFKNILIEQAGSGIKSELKPNRFLPLEIDLPSLSKQKEILQKLESVNSEIIELHEIVEQNEKLISKLRQCILQDAVQGKLTADWRKQNPKTESASELLKRINIEKERLIEEKVIKKEIQLVPISKKEIPFKIPQNWQWCRMQDLCPNISSGSTPPNSEFKNEGVPYLKVYNIRNQKIDFDYKSQFVSYEYHSIKLKRSILRPGDIIMNIVGPPLGKTAIIPNNFEEWNCNQAIVFFKPIIKILNLWIYTFLLSEDYLKRIVLIGTAGQDNISVTKSKNIEIPLPPLEEQKAIVEKVNQLLSNCDLLQQEINRSKANAEKLMQSVLSDLLGEENGIAQKSEIQEQKSQVIDRKRKFDGKTTYMELIKLLKEHGKLHAEELWKMSKFPNDIDAFYAELKTQIEEKKTIKEVEKGYLELV